MSPVQLHRWLDIGAVEAFSEDEPVAVEAAGIQMAIFRLEDQLYALHDLCTHGVARLSEGYVEDGCIECPLHQGLFDIRTGAAKCAPVTEAVRSFPVRVRDGRVEVAMAEQPALPDTVTADQPQAQPGHYSATLLEVRPLASDVRLLRLALDVSADSHVEPEAAEPFAWRPGQYVDIVQNQVRRSYSLAAVDGRELTLHVRHLPGGVFTDQLFGSGGAAPLIGVGDRLQIDGPHGQFGLQAGTRPKLMLATGTGFAPIQAMLQALIAAANQSPVYFYWGGRQLPDLYLHAQCLSWATRYPWFHYVPVLSQTAPAGWVGRLGYVTDAAILDWPDMQPFEVYACGSPAMVATAKTLCLQHGLAAEAFFADAFFSQADRHPLKQDGQAYMQESASKAT